MHEEWKMGVPPDPLEKMISRRSTYLYVNIDGTCWLDLMLMLILALLFSAV